MGWRDMCERNLQASRHRGYEFVTYFLLSRRTGYHTEMNPTAMTVAKMMSTAVAEGRG